MLNFDKLLTVKNNESLRLPPPKQHISSESEEITTSKRRVGVSRHIDSSDEDRLDFIIEIYKGEGVPTTTNLRKP